MTQEKTNERTEGKSTAPQGLPSEVPLRGGRAAASNISGPTVEQALYALLFVLALGLRLFSLGGLNVVSPLEAAQILPAWVDQSAGTLEESGLPEFRPPASPLLYTMQRALFLLTGGGSSFWARFPAACAGAGLVLAAWALRRRMGRDGALAAAVLFALDPWLLSFSRLADGSTLSVLTGVLLLAALFDERVEKVQVNRFAVVGGLFLISGPLAWLLVPLILYALFLLGGGPLARLTPGQGRQAAIVCAGTVVVGSTGLFSHTSGLSSIGESVGIAIAHLAGPPGGTGILPVGNEYTVVWALLRLLVDEPFLLLFGGAGAAIALFRASFLAPTLARKVVSEEEEVKSEKRSLVDDVWLNVLVVGTAWGLLLLILPGLTPVSLLVLGLPLLLLAAASATQMLRLAPVRTLLQSGAHLPAFATMGILLVTAFFWTGTVTSSLRDGHFDPRLAAFYLLIPVLGSFFVWWSGVRASGQVFGFLTLTAIFLAQASSSWMLNLRPEYDHSRSLYAETGDSVLGMLADDIGRLSSLRTGDPTEAPVYLQVDYSHLPFFLWHLRAVRDLRWHPGIKLKDVEEGALVVTQGGAATEGEGSQLPVNFVGSKYSVTERWLPTEIEHPGALLRWMLFRERMRISGGIPVRQEVELWVIREK
ncbi:MAG: glycosyltransferase family 39 protein [Caldilineaceae bacterium]|nr:glycosyltransferase family 39 protein [Caldilineaceae bacterium]MDE0337183.1 glycosyltransferase family 39 protein [Caldilineaceae bacterium]